MGNTDRAAGRPWDSSNSLLDIAAKGPVVMGIVNLAPESWLAPCAFDADRAIESACAMVEQGAAIVDVSGQATWPGAPVIPKEQELERVVTAMEGIVTAVGSRAIVSIETYRASVADSACALGACMINDVSGGMSDPRMCVVAARQGCWFVVTHMRGTPQTMQQFAQYSHVSTEVCGELKERVSRLEDAGVKKERLLLDPGLGLSKRVRHNLSILADLQNFVALGYPLLVSASRKFGIDRRPDERIGASIAAAAVAVLKGVSVIRSHDVEETVQAVRLLRAMSRERMTGSDARRQP